MQTKNNAVDFSKIKAGQILFPVVLFLLPFWNANEGVDYADTGYSLNNFADYANLGTTWKLATYLANLAGRLLMCLPGGGTLLGMNLYTSLFISGMAVAAYFFAKKRVAPWIAFVGEVLAISLCWCPTVILYNYLTYALMLAALLCLYHGLSEQKSGFLLAAGILLGSNVFVRFSNLAETAFILLVWYAAWQNGSRMEAVRNTLLCIVGYVAGYAAVFVPVCVRYGLDSYVHMLTGMSSMEASSERYSVWGMLTGPFLDYAKGLPWLMLLVGYAAAGWVLFRILPGRLVRVRGLLFLGGMPFLYRYFWGHAMFSTNYYSYGPMFWPTILVLIAAFGLCLYRLLRHSGTGETAGTEGIYHAEKQEKLLAFLVLLILLVTPLGSNNRSYPVMNNLFLVMPFVLSWGVELFRKLSFPIRATALVYFLFFSVQILLFGAVFTFGDEAPEQKRDAKIENNGILRGISTTRRKAETVEELTAYYEKYGAERELVCYGNIPAFPYYLEAGTAIGSAWPDLDTYAMYDYEADMRKLSEEAAAGCYPIILIHAELDAEDQAKEKYILLQQFIRQNGYSVVRETGDILVYDRTGAAAVPEGAGGREETR